jgi:arylsulfatase A-like enzyme
MTALEGKERSRRINVSTRRKSLVLITVDCLRADHCGFHGYSRPTTPFLNRLAAESFVVPTAVVAGAPTYYSLPAILAARMPLALGRDVIGLAPGESTLASALRDAGYATAAFSAANPYISARFGYDQGFETFEDFLNFGASPPQPTEQENSAAENLTHASSTRSNVNRALRQVAQSAGFGWLYDELYFQYCLRIAAPAVVSVDDSIDPLRRFPTAEALVDRALSWLESAMVESAENKPFFLWLHLMDPHSPYYPSKLAYQDLTGKEISASRARYLNEFWNRSDLAPAQLPKKKDSIVELYDAGIRSVDTQIARLVSRLKASGAWEECTLALTADHGEEFLEHGGRYHAPLKLREEIAHVPLLIRVPGAAKKEVAPKPFSHLHLAPTLLDILEVAAPATFDGMSLWRDLQQGTAWDVPAITECIYGCTNPLRREDRNGARLLSVRDDRHKLSIRLESGSDEALYDLEADPEEMKPLPPGKQKEIRGKLLHAARAHMRKTSDGRRASLRMKARVRDLGIELQSKSRERVPERVPARVPAQATRDRSLPGA